MKVLCEIKEVQVDNGGFDAIPRLPEWKLYTSVKVTDVDPLWVKLLNAETRHTHQELEDSGSHYRSMTSM